MYDFSENREEYEILLSPYKGQFIYENTTRENDMTIIHISYIPNDEIVCIRREPSPRKVQSPRRQVVYEDSSDDDYFN